MKKAIGGLLVVSMLSSPHLFDWNFLAYEFLRNQNKVIYAQMLDEDEKAEPEDIDGAMAAIDENSRIMTDLLKERGGVIEKIQSAMDLRIHAKMALTDEQIKEFQDFMTAYRSSDEFTKKILGELDQNKSLVRAQQEILNENTDYNLVFNQINLIINYQEQAIDNLIAIISLGESVLDMF